MNDFRVVVVGLGLVSQFWLPPLQGIEDVEIVAVVEPDGDRARDVLGRYALACPVYSGLDEALDDVRANLVVNLTPPALHRSVVETALSRGCHVFGEKPMAATIEDAQALTELAEQTGLTFAVMQNRRFHPAMRRLRAGIASGTIGEPVFVCADMFLAPRHRNTFLWTMESPLLREMGIHTFDQARFLTDAEPISVHCHEFNPSDSWFEGAAAAVCTFAFSGGIVFSYRGCCVADGFSTSYDAAWRVSGTHGTAVWDGIGNPACEVPLPPTEPDSPYPVERATWSAAAPRDATGHSECIDHLLDALRNGRRPETDCTDNIRSVAMLFAALRSARERRRVLLEELVPPARIV